MKKSTKALFCGKLFLNLKYGMCINKHKSSISENIQSTNCKEINSVGHQIELDEGKRTMDQINICTRLKLQSQINRRY